MKFSARFPTLILCAALLASCSTTAFHVGSNFDPGLFASQVVQGKTTKEDVRTWLGAPTGTGVRVDTDGTRYEEWTYYVAEGELSELSATRVKTLQIKFDSQGVVRGYAWSSSAR